MSYRRWSKEGEASKKQKDRGRDRGWDTGREGWDGKEGRRKKCNSQVTRKGKWLFTFV